jgi:surfeit locus 1 family protein
MSATSATAEDRRLRFHFSPIITLAAVVVLAVLLGLGTWQAGRYRESSSFITVYEQKHGGPPVTSLAVTPEVVGDRAEHFRYRRTELRGKLSTSEVQLLTARYKFAKPGYGVLAPLVVEGAPYPKILVYLGWVPRDRLEEYLQTLKPDQEVTVQGRLNKGDAPNPAAQPVGEYVWGTSEEQRRLNNPNVEKPASSPTGVVTYPTWRDTNLAALTGRIPGLDPELLIQAGKEAVGEEIDTDKLPLDGYRTPLRLPPQKHVEYAVTWYGVAFALILVYFGWAVRRGPPKPAPSEEPS